MRKLLLALTLGLLLTLAFYAVISRAAPAAPPSTLHSGHHFLPPYPNPRDRFGFDSGALSGYDVAQLHAGWYSNWGASLDPAHPDGLTYVQLIRFHAGSDPHDPDQVSVSPGKATIAQIAAAHPGSLWMMSNEPDSLYQGDPIYPEVYAHVYHEFYHYIKDLDPTALIANGGIVQPTPCRMEYLDIVLDTYQQAYGEPMPVDVWNIHAFTLREVYNSWGASTPPGVDPSCGIDYDIRDADDIGIFRDNLIAFRQWMKDQGEQDKPLIISEYGILWPDWLQDEDGRGFPPARVSHFMTQTFDLFLNETYPDVGYPADDYRLVQAWAWYSLSDDEQYNGHLFHSGSKTLSPMGETYADYTAALSDTQYTDLTVHSEAKLDISSLEGVNAASSYENTSATLSIAVPIANLGKLPVEDVPVVAQFDSRLFTSTISRSSRYIDEGLLSPVASIVLTQPTTYDFEYDFPVMIDPEGTIDDPREWNDTVTATLDGGVDARPDLSIPTMTWSVERTGVQSSALSITVTVGNRDGLWPSPSASVTLYLSDTQGALLTPPRGLIVPTIGSGSLATLTKEISLSNLQGGIYPLKLVVDEKNIVEERDEGNNQVEVDLDVRADLVAPSRVLGYPLGAGRMRFHLPVANEGDVASPAVSGTLSLTTTQGSLLLPNYRFAIPRIVKSGRVTLTEAVDLLPFNDDFLRMAVKVDSDNALYEQVEENNSAELKVPIVITSTLRPDAKSVLTSSSGNIAFVFPSGLVTESTEIRFTPRLTSELPPGPPLGIAAFSLDAYRAGRPVTLTPPLPITVIWNYTGTQAAALDKDALGLYRLIENDRWERVRCSGEKHPLDKNRLTTCLQHLSTFVFGQGYELYLPVVISNGEPASASEAQPDPQEPVLPGLPLRLPPWAVPDTSASHP